MAWFYLNLRRMHYVTDTSRQRRGQARRPSSDTAIESFGRGAVLPEPENGSQMAQTQVRGRHAVALEHTVKRGAHQVPRWSPGAHKDNHRVATAYACGRQHKLPLALLTAPQSGRPAAPSTCLPHVQHALPGKRHRTHAHQTEPSVDQPTGRTDEPDTQASHTQTLPLRHSR